MLSTSKILRSINLWYSTKKKKFLPRLGNFHASESFGTVPYRLNIFEVETKWSDRWSKFCSCLTNALTSQSNSDNCQVLAGVQFLGMAILCHKSVTHGQSCHLKLNTGQLNSKNQQILQDWAIRRLKLHFIIILRSMTGLDCLKLKTCFSCRLSYSSLACLAQEKSDRSFNTRRARLGGWRHSSQCLFDHPSSPLLFETRWA